MYLVYIENAFTWQFLNRCPPGTAGLTRALRRGETQKARGYNTAQVWGLAEVPVA